MPVKIQNSTLEILKTRINLADHIRSCGVELKPHGKDLIGHCSFHDDKTPSLVVTPAKNLWHCMGKCNEGGTIIDWEMKYYGISLSEAVERLKKKYSHFFNGNGKKTDNLPAKQEINITTPEIQKVLRRVLESYNRHLKENKKPIDYLLKRGIIYGELVDEFLIGYSDGSLIEKIPAGDEKTLQILTDIGLIHKTKTNNNIKAGYIEHFKDYIVFPIMDEHRTITEIYGRSITRENINHKYLPGPHRGFFNQKALIHNEIIICESIIDALSIMTLGIKHVIAGYGTNGFSDEMLRLLETGKVKKAYIAYDNDRNKTGDKAAAKLANKLAKLGITSNRINFPSGMDANDFICKVENPADEFNKLLENAELLKEGQNKDNSFTLAGILTESDTDANKQKEVSYEEKNGEYLFTEGPRTYLVRGVNTNKNNTTLKVFLRAVSNGKFYNDNNLDLFNAKSVSCFIKSASEILELERPVIKKDLDSIILVLDKKLNEVISTGEKPEPVEYKLNLHYHHKAMELVRAPLLMKYVIEAVQKCGIVGEALSIAVCFLSTISRKLSRPFHVLIQSLHATDTSESLLHG
jgi:DNA primase catalytic core